jgi:hypothetical protein
VGGVIDCKNAKIPRYVIECKNTIILKGQRLKEKKFKTCGASPFAIFGDTHASSHLLRSGKPRRMVTVTATVVHPSRSGAIATNLTNQKSHISDLFYRTK